MPKFWNFKKLLGYKTKNTGFVVNLLQIIMLNVFTGIKILDPFLKKLEPPMVCNFF